MVQVRSKPKGNSKVTKATPASIVLMVILLVYSLSLIAILVFGLSMSLKSQYEYDSLKNVLGLPQGTLEYGPFENYIRVFQKLSYKGADKSYFSALFGNISNNFSDTEFTFANFALNSFIYCIFGSFCKTFVACLAGYLVAKYRYKFSKALYVTMLVVLAVPVVGSAPSFVSFSMDLGIYDSYVGMILNNLNFTGIYFFVFVAYFEGVSDVYVEAAEIDGASQFRTFFQVIFPLVSKLFWTVFLLNFIVLWNDYQNPMLYYPNHPTLSFALYHLIHYSETGCDNVVRIAGTMVLAIPITILFIATRNVLLGNMSAGGIKE